MKRPVPPIRPYCSALHLNLVEPQPMLKRFVSLELARANQEGYYPLMDNLPDGIKPEQIVFHICATYDDYDDGEEWVPGYFVTEPNKEYHSQLKTFEKQSQQKDKEIARHASKMNTYDKAFKKYEAALKEYNSWNKEQEIARLEKKLKSLKSRRAKKLPDR